MWYFPIGVTSMSSLILRPPPVCSSCWSKLVLKWAKPHWKSGRMKPVQPNHFSNTSIKDLSTHALCGVSMQGRVCAARVSQQLLEFGYKWADPGTLLVQELLHTARLYHLCHIQKGRRASQHKYKIDTDVLSCRATPFCWENVKHNFSRKPNLI